MQPVRSNNKKEREIVRKINKAKNELIDLKGNDFNSSKYTKQIYKKR